MMTFFSAARTLSLKTLCLLNCASLSPSSLFHFALHLLQSDHALSSSTSLGVFPSHESRSMTAAAAIELASIALLRHPTPVELPVISVLHWSLAHLQRGAATQRPADVLVLQRALDHFCTVAFELHLVDWELVLQWSELALSSSSSAAVAAETSTASAVTHDTAFLPQSTGAQDTTPMSALPGGGLARLLQRGHWIGKKWLLTSLLVHLQNAEIAQAQEAEEQEAVLRRCLKVAYNSTTSDILDLEIAGLRLIQWLLDVCFFSILFFPPFE